MNYLERLFEPDCLQVLISFQEPAQKSLFLSFSSLSRFLSQAITRKNISHSFPYTPKQLQKNISLSPQNPLSKLPLSQTACNSKFLTLSHGLPLSL